MRDKIDARLIMITFSIALALLILGYFTYGKFIEHLERPNKNKITAAYSKADGVDFIPMPSWKVFMIQFLNIAGLGPIFGAIMGAKFGTASYLWIVFGCIFAGAVHDYISGMFSLRMNGLSLPNIVGLYLGEKTKKVLVCFIVILLVLVGAVFISGPAELLAGYTTQWMNEYFWIIIIFVYYVLAALFPIDVIIGRVYPFFAAALIFMALGLLFMLYWHMPALPEIWEGLGTNLNKDPESTPIFPMMFVSIACGAISGFHATQSPLMARCMKNEKVGRPIFYGAMITEGIVALIWAAVATWFFGEYGTSDPETGKAFSAAYVAKSVSSEWLGTVGSFLAILGIVFAPITSGDTALRSARLTVADFFKIDQRTIKRRLMVGLPIFVACAGVLVFSLSNADGFGIIWRYFAWSNQLLAAVTLWALSVHLLFNLKWYFVTLVPALFMTMVCSTYFFCARECLGLPLTISYILGFVITLVCLFLFLRTRRWFMKNKGK